MIYRINDILSQSHRKGVVGRDLKDPVVPSPSYHEQGCHPLVWIGYPQPHLATCSRTSLLYEQRISS